LNVNEIKTSENTKELCCANVVQALGGAAY